MIIRLSVCPFVCLLAGLHKYFCFELHEKNSEDGSNDLN